jgi:PAS domain-containing protein
VGAAFSRPCCGGRAAGRTASCSDSSARLDPRPGIRIRELRGEAALDRAERERMAVLVEDLSSGLGEGLVVVDTGLKIRLINRVALRFCGIEGVRTGAHLLEIFREPEGVEAFEWAAAGGRPGPIIVSNPRGLWRRAFRARRRRGGPAVRGQPDPAGGRVPAPFRAGPVARAAVAADRAADHGRGDGG